MILLTYNVNGIRASISHGLIKLLKGINADIVCLQEVKADTNAIETIKYLFEDIGYKTFWNPAQKRGYSGTAILTKVEPLKIDRSIGHHIDSEGRTILSEFDKYYVINGYFPFSRGDLSRLDLKTSYNELLFTQVVDMSFIKPVILCGDLNVARDWRDVYEGARKPTRAGYTDIERNVFNKFLQEGFIDAFRLFNDEPENYTWYSYYKDSRKKKNGWRIDYILVSKELKNKVVSCSIMKNVTMSDHVPLIMKMID